jgi:hypothetical protein
VNTPPLRRKRTPEEAEFLVETRKLDAAVFAMLQAGEISGNHRDAASHRLIEARLLAEKGHLGEARQRSYALPLLSRNGERTHRGIRSNRRPARHGNDGRSGYTHAADCYLARGSVSFRTTDQDLEARMVKKSVLIENTRDLGWSAAAVNVT